MRTRVVVFIAFISVAFAVAACSGSSGETQAPGSAAPRPDRVDPTDGVPPGPEPVQATPIQGVDIAPDGLSVRVTFVGSAEFDPANPCTHAYEARAMVAGDELQIGIFARPHPLDLPRNAACELIGYPRTLLVQLDEPFHGTSVRDLAGPLILLERPAGLYEISGLPQGWFLRSEESLPDSSTGRWSRMFSPVAEPGPTDSSIQVIQAFGGPANTIGGDIQPPVLINGVQATFYLHAPSGEMVLVWTIGDDGVALVGNLRDFSTDEFVELARSVGPAP